MCGIAGIVHFDTERRVDRAVLERMTDVLSHRGPDGRGFHVNNVGLGHRRLAIIDLCSGDQPMFSEDRSLALVFNGEIYNYIELRDELERFGHKFDRPRRIRKLFSRHISNGAWKARRSSMACGLSPSGMRAQQQLLVSRDRMGKNLCTTPCGIIHLSLAPRLRASCGASAL